MTVKERVNLVNGIDIDALQETIAAIQHEPQRGRCKFRAKNKWVDGNHNRSTITDYCRGEEVLTHAEEFELHADEPAWLAGHDTAPSPEEHLLHALAGCFTSSIVAHAAVRGIWIEELESEIEGDIDLRGFLGLDPKTPKGFTDIRVNFKVKTDLENLEMLKSLAEMSPVYNTILPGVKVEITVERK